MRPRPLRRLASVSLCLVALGLPPFVLEARAEKVLAKEGDWEVYTDGRVAAFVSYVRGDGLPRNAVDAAGVPIHDVQGGGLDAVAERQPPAVPGEVSQGTIEGMRVRSGFIGNTLGLGVRVRDESLVFTGYIQIWAYVESEARRKTQPNLADVRQGYAKVEGSWGSLLAGRARALFSRGATDIDVLYGHRYGVGYPGNIDSNGPTAGHIGFGVLGSGFAAGLVYATPVLAGLQLTVGAYDPIQLNGAWTRTKWVRPEAELTFERPLGQWGKIVFFGNGAYQKLYKAESTEETTASGVGYGGRFEAGPVRLGVAGHYGTGLGLKYALEPGDATIDPQTALRKFDGYYLQSQLVLGKVDLSAGWGIARVFLNPIDNTPDPNTGNIPHSVLKYQMGISAGIVYHLRPWFHLDADVFRAEARWFLGERQLVTIANGGMTFTW